MFKRVISLLLCILIVSAISFSLCSCKDDKGDEYPVTVNNLTIEKEPLNIVVLSDCLADVISYMGYDLKMVGRSAETDQEFLSVVPVVGTTSEPDVNAIVSNLADLVIADSTLSESSKSALSAQNIPVLILDKAKSFEELKALYVNLGTALGGNVTGRETGTTSYDELMNTISDFKGAIPQKAVRSACYLYLNENSELCTLTKSTIEHELFSYNGAINVFGSQETPQVDLELLKISTPTFIFYDNDAVLDFLRNDAELSNMGALKNGKTYQIEKKLLSRQGTTYEELIYNMIEYMFITSVATPDEATPDEQAKNTVTEEATQTEETVVGFVEEI